MKSMLSIKNYCNICSPLLVKENCNSSDFPLRVHLTHPITLAPSGSHSHSVLFLVLSYMFVSLNIILQGFDVILLNFFSLF